MLIPPLHHQLTATMRCMNPSPIYIFHNMLVHKLQLILNHASLNNLQDISKHNPFPYIQSPKHFCTPITFSSSIESLQAPAVYPRASHIHHKILYDISSDTCGPNIPLLLRVNVQLITFLDNDSQYLPVYGLQSKSQVPQAIQTSLTQISTHHPSPLVVPMR